MTKIIVCIGQSASGKTTWIKNNFILSANKIKYSDAPLKQTIIDNKYLLLGHYKGEKRCEGTDEYSYTAMPIIMMLIGQEVGNYDNIIVEGDRITNIDFFAFLNTLEKVNTEIHYFSCSVEESIKRRIKTGSKGSETFVKSTKTKSFKMILFAKNYLGFDIIEHQTGKEIKQKGLLDNI